MLDLKALRSDPPSARAALARRGDVPAGAVDEVLALDAERRAATEQAERLRARQKQDARIGTSARAAASSSCCATMAAASWRPSATRHSW